MADPDLQAKLESEAPQAKPWSSWQDRKIEHELNLDNVALWRWSRKGQSPGE
jgi:hypothetical protein